MKRTGMIIAALAFVCMLALTAQAQTETYTISGRVTWKGKGHDGEPVVGAKIRIGPGNYTATTDADGRYTVTGVKTGPHTLRVKAKKPNGSVTKAVTVDGNETVDIQLRYRSTAIRRRNNGVGLQRQ